MSSLVEGQSSQINLEMTHKPKYDNKNENKVSEDNSLGGKLTTTKQEISIIDSIQTPPTSERLRNIPSVYINNTDIVLLRMNELDKLKNNNKFPSNNNSLCKCSKQVKYNILTIIAIVILIIILFFFIKWKAEF